LPNEPIQVVADTGPQQCCDRGLVPEDDPEEGEQQDHDVTINFGKPRLSGFEECQALALDRVDCGLYSAVAKQDGVPVPGSEILSDLVSGGAPGVALKVPEDGDVDLVDGSLKASFDLAAADSTSNDGLKLNASFPQCFDPAAVDLVLDDDNDTSNENDSLKSRYEFSNTVDDDFAFLPEALRTRTINFSIQSLHPSTLAKKPLPLLFRIVIFLPWCVAVGGMIVMYPEYLESIAFSPLAGFITPVPKGIRRFAHWGETAFQHVWIFLGFLACVMWLNPMVGWMLVGGVAAQGVNAWWDFKVDRNVRLGEDDRQTIYLVLWGYGCADEYLEIGKKGEGYVLWQREKQWCEDMQEVWSLTENGLRCWTVLLDRF
jgi:hypothetical protein